ncbi:MAG TPA: adenylyl-sulfate kinase [Acidimicrobiales bacterium]|nr:adenylyl-sulfate kinase [Acidimicrobiales bacterium]
MSTAADRNLTWHAGQVARDQRWSALGAHGATVWFTGLSGSGKSTVAAAVERRLIDAGRPAYVLDGDNLRHGLNADLGFGDDDRAENVRRLGEVARLMADAGLVALVPAISPFRTGREAARAAHAEAGLPFFEVHLATPLDECERRDPKGLYARARAGGLAGLTGIDSPYEAPEHPELVLVPDDGDVDRQAARVLELLEG